ncbi:SidA/IucD/PvdA family monooxygenase [Spirilliplanes yamanashiensis]|uniref:L-lysine N6-monooxygenase MbtG n=1 Tax=Spirilliplanes yamanashiensis TaxID=42233 RepID=A0A8J3YF42_9ACTN|nr:SidA/IucD/PvdA family monooxygenase [Spirilliplanes yamanashiensis]MDP9815205.1 L-ornithine N5-oxygenase [Spirilliplanes yamanashiensis]GIJ06527.1 lysine/ornithine N-monooxygenase [Spirilliplanes yamanashiensis]
MGSRVVDLVGVGFGPANVALAVAIAEHNARAERDADRVEASFVERQDRFGWHRGALLDGATMRTPFLTDLVTPRNPASEYSFVSFLHAHDRLGAFGELGTAYPLRQEFHAYLEWVAGRFAAQVAYGHTAVDVVPGGDVVDVVTRHAGGTRVLRARAVVVAAGLVPSLPAGVTPSARVWHNAGLALHAARLAPGDPRRFVVAGAGQGAAESVAYLHRRFPAAEVCWLPFPAGGAPDDGFAGRPFAPEAVDTFFGAPADVKRMLLDHHGTTNHAGVETELVRALRRSSYAGRVTGEDRLRLLEAARVTSVDDRGGGVTATVEFLASGDVVPLDADAVVFATGLRPADPTAVLGATAALCRRDDEGRLLVDHDYRVVTDDALTAGVYLQGGTEHVHGVTASLLSSVALRAGDILDSVVAAVADRRPARTDRRTA